MNNRFSRSNDPDNLAAQTILYFKEMTPVAQGQIVDTSIKYLEHLLELQYYKIQKLQLGEQLLIYNIDFINDTLKEFEGNTDKTLEPYLAKLLDTKISCLNRLIEIHDKLNLLLNGDLDG